MPTTKQRTPQPRQRTANKPQRAKITRLERLLGIKSKPTTAQGTLPYLTMYKDGICHVKGRYYTKTMEYNDINYRLALEDEKGSILENYRNFLNAFDSGTRLQLSFVNAPGNIEDLESSIVIDGQDARYDNVRREYVEMLQTQMSKGNSGLLKRKYITFGVEAQSLKEARSRLGRIEVDVGHNYRAMGVTAWPLTGKERLKVLHGQLHPDGQKRLHFDWSDLPKTGLSTKDYIAPSSFNFSDKSTFKIGDTLGTVSFKQIMAAGLEDSVLRDYIESEHPITVNIHLQPVDQQAAIKQARKAFAALNAQKAQEQKKAFQNNYDMDIIPQLLKDNLESAQGMMEHLQEKDERQFLATVLIMNTAGSKQKLENIVKSTSGITQKHNCQLKRLDYQQEQGLCSSLVLGDNQLDLQRTMTTSSMAIFIPFTSAELFQGPGALYYGLNAVSGNMIMADRRRLINPNGLILGMPGSGKSFFAKREIANVMLSTLDDVMIIDPEGEYPALVDELYGEVIKLSASSDHRINPLDINDNYNDGGDPLKLKSTFVVSFCEAVLGGNQGLAQKEKSIIDRCLLKIYKEFFVDWNPEKMPILGDLYTELMEQPEPEAKNLATALEMFVTGSQNVFNGQTNVDLKNRLVCFDIKELGATLKTVGMLILQDALWNRVSYNRSKKKFTWVYIDEFHLLLKEKQTADFSVGIFKRFRKWQGVPTGITQNVKDFLSSADAKNILDCTPFIVLLSQAGGDRQVLSEHLGISQEQERYITASGVGQGLLRYDNVTVPFIDRFPTDTMLYKLMTTKPGEVHYEQKAS